MECLDFCITTLSAVVYSTLVGGFNNAGKHSIGIMDPRAKLRGNIHKMVVFVTIIMILAPGSGRGV